MGVVDWIIIIAVALTVGLIIGTAIWKKATGRSVGCGCDCSACSSCSGCSAVKKDKGEENAKA